MNRNKLQNFFFNNLLGVQKCHTYSMHWDLGAMVMPLRILKEKLSLYHHIKTLPQTSISAQVLDVQERLHLPGLHQDVQGFLAQHGVVDVKEFSKQKWKDFTKKKIAEMNRSFILEEIKTSKKLDYFSLASENFELKPYFLSLNLADSRMKHRVRSKCVKTCRTHFPSDQGNISEMFRCYNCNEIDSLEHWQTSNCYKQLREGTKLDRDEELVEFYRGVMKLRQEND